MPNNINISQIRIKRGNTAAASTYIGPIGELLYDTGLQTIRIQDGVTPGGHIVQGAGGNVDLTGYASLAQLSANVITLTSAITGANAAIVTANTGMKSYVDSVTTLWTANAATQAVVLGTLTANAATQTTEINLLQANIIAANTAITALQSNAAVQQALLDTLTGNAASQAISLNTLTSNAATQANSLTTLLANAVAQQTSLIDLVANAATQAQQIASVTGTYSNANVAAYLPTYAGDISAGNVTFLDNTVQSTGYTAQRSSQLIQSAGRTWTLATDAYGNTTVTGTSVHLDFTDFLRFIGADFQQWSIKDNTGQVFYFQGSSGNTDNVNLGIVPYGDPAATVYFPIIVRSADYAEGTYSTLADSLNGNVFSIRGDGSIKFADDTVQHTAFLGDRLTTDNGNIALTVEKTIFSSKGRVLFPGDLTLSTINNTDNQLLRLNTNTDSSSFTIRSDNNKTGSDYKEAELIVNNNGTVSMLTYVDGVQQYFALDHRGYLIFPGDVSYWANENSFYTTSNIGLRTDTHHWNFEADGSMIFPSGLTVGNGPGDYIQSNELLGVNGTEVAVTGGTSGNISQVYLLHTGNVAIRTNYNNTTDHFWTFDTDGVLTIPNGGKLGGLQYADGIDLYASGTMPYAQVNYDNKNYIYVDNGVSQLQTPNVNIIANTVGGSAVVTTTDFDDTNVIRTWDFDRFGNLTLPFSGSPGPGYGGGITFGDGTYQQTAYTGAVTYSDADVAAYLSSGNLETAWVHGNLTVGNLIVNGNTTTINTQSYTVNDNILQIAADNPADILDIGFVGHRTVGSTLQHTGLVRDASAGNWKLFSNVTTQPGNTVDFTNAIYDDLVAGTVTGTDFKFANGISILSTVAGTYSNTNVAAYLTSQNITSANIGAYQTWANATFSQVGGAGSTYSNANVVAMLGANSTVTIGNVSSFPVQTNVSSILLGNVTSVWGGYAGSLTNTSLTNNIFYDVNGVQRYRTATSTGAATLGISGGTGFVFHGIGGTTVANAASSLTLWATIGPSGISTSNNLGITSAGTLAVNATGGITTNQTTFPLVNTTATTINFGGAATTINLGSTAVGGTGSNVFVGNAIGTNNGNLTVRAYGTYNTLTLYSIQGGYNSPPYTNQSLTGGSGTGMTASYSSTGGYISTITVVNPGSGYKNGDILTVPGGLGSTVILTNYNSGFVGTGLANYIFGMDGNLVLPGAANILFTNGVSVLSTVTGTYSNTSVAAYLTTANISTTGNLTAAYITTSGSYGNITGANVISANTVTVSNGIFWANGTAWSSSGGSGADDVLRANVGAYQIWANANVAGLYNSILGANAAIVTANTALKSYTDNQISTAINNLINSAPGTLDTLAEIAANLASEASAIGAITNSITATNANVTAANAAIATLQSQVYSNATVASYLPVYNGNVGVDNLTNTSAVKVNASNNTWQFGLSFGQPAIQLPSGSFISDNSGVIATQVLGSGSYSVITSASGGAKTWTFDSSGNFTFPDTTVQTTAYPGTSILNSVNANITAANTAIQTVNANIGAYYFWNNANTLSMVNSITSVAANVTAANAVISTLQANIGSFYTYANATYTGGGASTYSNANVASYLPTYSGNIGAGNIVTTGATSGNISGANYISANAFQVSTGIFWANGTAWSSSGGGTTYSNANVASYLTAGNISVGSAGFTILPNIVAQFTSNVNSYGQVNMQNINSGSAATTEIVATANNGTDTIFFVDLGIAGSAYNVNAPLNSLGNVIYANDAYLYAQGNTGANVGGNLAIGTSTPGRTVTIFAGGINNTSNVATFANTGMTVYANITAGNITATHYGNSIGTTATYSGNVTAANIVTTGTYGNITNANVISANNLVVSGYGVTMANRPAFRIYGGSPSWFNTSNVNLKGSSIVVDYNQGNYFNSTTGIFTAPTAGLYQVTFNARVGSNNSQNQVLVGKNGQSSAGNVAVMWESDTNTGTAIHYGVTTVIKLAANDWLSANITAGNIQFDQNDSWTVTYIG